MAFAKSVAPIAFSILPPILFMYCSTPYSIHIKTIPPGDYAIYVDTVNYGSTSTKGDTAIRTNKLSVIKSHLLELKGNDSYACLKFPASDSSNWRYSVNAYSIRSKSHSDFDVTFLFNANLVPSPFTETDLNDKNPRKTFKFNKNYDTPAIGYCILAPDTNRYAYFGLKRHVDRYLGNNNYSWIPANSILQALVNDTSLKSGSDSLSPEVWEEAVKQNINYLVMFFGYSLNGSKTVAPADIGASLAVTSLGILAGSMTGIFFFGMPTGQSITMQPTIFCAVFSVTPNRCIFIGKESLTTYNNYDVKTQANTILSRLFKRIDMLAR